MQQVAQEYGRIWVSHIACVCSALAHWEFKGRHDGVAKAGHWCLCRKYVLEVADKWNEHVPGKVRESETVKILWDLATQTNHQLEHNRPDLVVVDKQQAVCQIIDAAVPGNARVELKEKETIDKCQDLAREFRTLWLYIWPVSGQGFQNTKWPAVPYSQWISQNRKIPANLNYHLSIKKSQAILKCFIDLKYRVWFTLGSEDETMLFDNA